jgi:hypothetical protein
VNLIDKLWVACSSEGYQGQETLYFQALPRSSWQYPRSGAMAEDMTELSDAHQRVWSFVLPNWVRSTEPSTFGAEAIPMSHHPWGPSASCFPSPHLIVFPGCWGCSCIFFFPCVLALLFQLFMFWATKYSNNQEFARVIRMDPMCPFCVKSSHVHFCPNLLVSSIRMDVRKFSFSLGLPFGCIVIENKFVIAITMIEKFQSLNFHWSKLFNYCSWGDRKILVIKIMTIETFRSTFVGRSNFSQYHLRDNQIILVVKLCWVIKITSCILNSLSPLRCVTVGFVLFNKQWLPYIFGRRGETFMGV